MLPQYVEYIINNKEKSTMSRIYGIYTVKMPGVKAVSLMFQKNCIQIHPGNKILQTFDMKGSLFQRNVINFDLHQDDEVVSNPSSNDSDIFQRQ